MAVSVMCTYAATHDLLSATICRRLFVVKNLALLDFFRADDSSQTTLVGLRRIIIGCIAPFSHTVFGWINSLCRFHVIYHGGSTREGTSHVDVK